MGKAAAGSGDKLSVSSASSNTHVLTTSSSTETHQCDFTVTISAAGSANVFIGGIAAAIDNGQSESNGTHPTLDSLTGSWSPLLGKTGKIKGGSNTVSINGNPAVRHDDPADCCSFNGTVVVQNASTSTVLIGD